MRIHIIALAALALSAPTGAGIPEIYHPRMSGENFIRHMLSPPDGGLASMQRERAMAYMEGVIDATVGSRWCPGKKNVPHELDYVMAEELDRLSSAQLKTNAAKLMLDALAAQYPCSSGAAR